MGRPPRRHTARTRTTSGGPATGEGPARATRPALGVGLSAGSRVPLTTSVAACVWAAFALAALLPLTSMQSAPVPAEPSSWQEELMTPGFRGIPRRTLCRAVVMMQYVTIVAATKIAVFPNLTGQSELSFRRPTRCADSRPVPEDTPGTGRPTPLFTSVVGSGASPECRIQTPRTASRTSHVNSTSRTE